MAVELSVVLFKSNLYSSVLLVHAAEVELGLYPYSDILNFDDLFYSSSQRAETKLRRGSCGYPITVFPKKLTDYSGIILH